VRSGLLDQGVWLVQLGLRDLRVRLVLLVRLVLSGLARAPLRFPATTSTRFHLAWVKFKRGCGLVAVAAGLRAILDLPVGRVAAVVIKRRFFSPLLLDQPVPLLSGAGGALDQQGSMGAMGALVGSHTSIVKNASSSSVLLVV